MAVEKEAKIEEQQFGPAMSFDSEGPESQVRALSPQEEFDLQEPQEGFDEEFFKEPEVLEGTIAGRRFHRGQSGIKGPQLFWQTRRVEIMAILGASSMTRFGRFTPGWGHEAQDFLQEDLPFFARKWDRTGSGQPDLSTVRKHGASKDFFDVDEAVRERDGDREAKIAKPDDSFCTGYIGPPDEEHPAISKTIFSNSASEPSENQD